MLTSLRTAAAAAASPAPLPPPSCMRCRSAAEVPRRMPKNGVCTTCRSRPPSRRAAVSASSRTHTHAAAMEPAEVPGEGE
eukprot:scaffold5284_cov42-Phaeocystis_antarctica.AAC.1